MNIISRSLPGTKRSPVPNAPKRFPVGEKAIVNWLKAHGAVPTPPDIKARLVASGDWGYPTEEPLPSLPSKLRRRTGPKHR